MSQSLLSVEPWKISLNDRISYLNECVQKNYKISVILYNNDDSPSFRYRVYNIFQILKNSSQWKVVYFYLDELDTLQLLLCNIDLLIISRMQWTGALQTFITEVKQRKIPLAFDCDDLVFAPKFLPIIANTIGLSDEKLEKEWFPEVSRTEAIACQCDFYIATNAYLADMFTKQFSKKSYVIPNFINEEQRKVSEECCKSKQKLKDYKKFTIGYFSGSKSHINDFRVVSAQLNELLTEFDNINFLIVGYMELPKYMMHFIAEKRIAILPPVDFLELQKLTASVDVNIVPLVVNEFTNCKSELKFFESAIVDTMTVASDSFAYTQCIKNGENGFLCKPIQWYDVLKEIYLKKVDVDSIVKKAKQDALENFSGKKILNQIESVFNNIVFS